MSLLTVSFDIKPKAIVSFYGYGDIIADWYCKQSSFYCQKPYKQSVVMANKLQTMGIENKLITLKGKNYAFDYDMKDKQVILAFEEVLSLKKNI